MKIVQQTQGFIKDFKFGMKLEKTVDVESMCKHAPARGIWGHAFPKNSNTNAMKLYLGHSRANLLNFKVQHPQWGEGDLNEIIAVQGMCNFFHENECSEIEFGAFLKYFCIFQSTTYTEILDEEGFLKLCSIVRIATWWTTMWRVFGILEHFRQNSGQGNPFLIFSFS